ncbi:flavin-nucleotide-binding protein-like protein (plasmid) [Haloterrigena turkmenica DSM 5511]|uniref:Flavin-nucleotide-binding protein-like protein n=1 Tax=Haloterrigena turkmenica (strain ATCC 51198 / DSM 5511 / JCM 9101 / NCIMB 13204 / VKM B-1734 / 4k) TaxID=543526 RepID=D2S122_HALTV|nr:pyridoxamine 5'-phosphate oxidase family protein [Haloterrigena turkmenica]ADB63069.1 flavin-nucleotide-binding protein-like protein [Haloterrigena turkmenica DSM 5511]
MSIDELQEYGLVKMDENEIEGFLSSQKTGVLGLPAEDGPYLLPISYGYNGHDRLYFTYLLGSNSRKGTLSEATDTARFLVYKVDTPYNWQSVLLTGQLSAIPETEWDALDEISHAAWRPAVFESATLSGDVRVYEFQIDEQTGIKHQGLPPSLEPDGM